MPSKQNTLSRYGFKFPAKVSTTKPLYIRHETLLRNACGIFKSGHILRKSLVPSWVTDSAHGTFTEEGEEYAKDPRVSLSDHVLYDPQWNDKYHDVDASYWLLFREQFAPMSFGGECYFVVEFSELLHTLYNNNVYCSWAFNASSDYGFLNVPWFDNVNALREWMYRPAVIENHICDWNEVVMCTDAIPLDYLNPVFCVEPTHLGSKHIAALAKLVHKRGWHLRTVGGWFE